MPELPEVETIRRQVAPWVVGRRIVTAWADVPRRVTPDLATLMREARGRRIIDACRHGKQLWFPLEGSWHLLVHLGMSGRLQVVVAGGEASRHLHARFTLDDGQELQFTDPRTFGAVGVAPDLGFLAAVGPDPLTDAFDAEAVVEALRGRRTAVKAALLDQKMVAGLGNIYADEVCWLARVHPMQRADRIARARLRLLVSHVRPVLERAIVARGATLKDGGYQDLFGRAGEYFPYAYGTTGEPCQRCGRAMQRGTLGAGKSARSYHFCPRCQRR